MKHWKRILAAALSAILLCGVYFAVSGISVPRASAANGDTVSPQSEPSFTDVPAEAWYAEAVSWCRENSIMSGTSDTTFAPEASMTRAMMVTVLHRAAGTPASTGENVFTDNVPGLWSYDAVVWAAANNILDGYGEGSKSPKALCFTAVCRKRRQWNGRQGCWRSLESVPQEHPSIRISFPEG